MCHGPPYFTVLHGIYHRIVRHLNCIDTRHAGLDNDNTPLNCLFEELIPCGGVSGCWPVGELVYNCLLFDTCNDYMINVSSGGLTAIRGSGHCT
jgi:hypothetical protein